MQTDRKKTERSMSSLTPPCRHRLFAVLANLLAAVLAISGCQAYHVYQIGGTRQREQGNQPSTEWKQKRLNSFFWGGVRQDLAVDDCQDADGTRFGIEEVKVETGLGYVLASSLTLGFWVPIKVGYRCAKPPVTTGRLQ
jgi:hypothetical protein